MREEKRVIIVNPSDITAYEPPHSKDLKLCNLLGTGTSKHVEIFWGEYGGQGKTEKQIQNFDQSIFILEGKVRFICGKVEGIAQKRDMVFIPAGVEYQTASSGAKFVSLQSSKKGADVSGDLQDGISIIRVDEVPVYTPPGHEDTYNRLLIGPEMGCEGAEIILGKFGKKGTAHPHSHPYEQILFLLEGINENISNGIVQQTRAGELKFIPGDLEHQSFGKTDVTEFLLIYTPPRSTFSD